MEEWGAAGSSLGAGLSRLTEETLKGLWSPLVFRACLVFCDTVETPWIWGGQAGFDPHDCLLLSCGPGLLSAQQEWPDLMRGAGGA